MYDTNFCPACGKNLSAGSTYCPACGANLGDPGGNIRINELENGKNIERTKIAAVLLLITAVLAIGSGLWTYFAIADFMHSIVDSSPEIADMINVESLISIMEVMGLISVVIGVIGIPAAWLAFKRKAWEVTVILCILVTALGNLILGIIALYLIWKARPVFEGKEQSQNQY